MNIELETLAKAVADRIAQPIPVNLAVWSSQDIAAYLRVTPKYVTNHLSNRPGFPTPTRLPSDGGQGRLRWQAKDVIAWWGRQR